ncbi:THAP domain-containing protein 3-like [Gouania willdenowi]|uniref:THAP domain-containing protein 3-like n=1 Tax=Gouania willdenowi TaxID=441366 RepID=UPI0010566221|nr:THAP domain-containing protein 3-like [Gouania willdenowi]
MPVCSASGCPYQPKRFMDRRSTHAFPLNNPALCKQWVKNVGREDFIPSKTSRLCSAHFEESCFQVDMYAKYLPQALIASNRVRAKKLKPDAVPTRFSHRPLIKQSQEPRMEPSEREDKAQCESMGTDRLRKLWPRPPPPLAAPTMISYTLVETWLPPHLTPLYARRVLREHAYFSSSSPPKPTYPPPPFSGSSVGEVKHIKKEQEEFWVKEEEEKLCAYQEGDFIAVCVKSEDDEEEKPQCSELQWRLSEENMKEEPSTFGSADLIKAEPPQDISGEQTHSDGEEMDSGNGGDHSDDDD